MREKVVNGERTFNVDFNQKDSRGYILTQDVDTKCKFFLPYFVIKNFKEGK